MSETRTVAGTDTAIATEANETASENVIAIVTVTGIVTGIAEMMFGKIVILLAQVHRRLVSRLQCQRIGHFQLDLILGITEMVRVKTDWAKDEDPPMTIPKEALSGVLERTAIERTEVAAHLIRTRTIEVATLTEDGRIGKVLITMVVLRWTRSGTREYPRVPLRRKFFRSPHRPHLAPCRPRIFRGQGRVTVVFPTVTDFVTTHPL